MKPWHVTSYKKKITCTWCKKKKEVTVLNVIPKTCCDKCRKARSYALNRAWLKRNPKRIDAYNETRRIKDKKQNVNYVSAYTYEANESLLVR